MSGAMRIDSPPEALGVLALAARTRPEIVARTLRAERAVTEPRDAGGWPSPWRLAVAARLARLNGRADLAAHYLGRVSDEATRVVADPACPGRDARERVVLSFMDRVAVEPRAVVADDIERLKAADVTEADIVRLCELNAFMAYLVRVLAGLDALAGTGA